LGVKSLLLVSPAMVLISWNEQAKRWRREAPGAITHAFGYEIFTKLQKKAAVPEAEMLILDEAQYLANPKSQRSRAAAAWREANPTLPILALTGTPMNSRPRDLWHILNLLWPGRFGTKWQFEKRYCDGKFEEIPNAQQTVWVAEGASRSEELGARLRGLMLRRTKSQVALELPPRTRSIVEVDLPPAARKALARAAASIDGGGGVSGLLSSVEEYKLDACCELVEQARSAGERVLVLTTRKESAGLLGRRLNAPSVDGEDSVGERQRKLEGADVAVATLYSVGVGVNYLTGFSTLIFAGLDWLPSVILQGEARVHRIGQANPVTIYYLIGKGTLDEVVRERVLERLETFAAIAGEGDDQLGRDLGGGDEEELLAGIVAAVRKGH
jgi:SWI/SNF-related matrix-associated actin-dependent regulator 1 of chromatin subfamily A